MNIFDIMECDEEHLVELINANFESDPVLREIYDDSSIRNLARNRKDYDNYLIWILASDNYFASHLRHQIACDLDTLRSEGSLESFRDKLKEYKRVQIEGYLTELYFAAHYKRKGFQIELEPKVTEKGKLADFKATKLAKEIFFEAKDLFLQDVMDEDKINRLLQNKFRDINYPFVLSMEKHPSLTVDDLGSLRSFVEARLKQLSEIGVLSFPQVFFFPQEKEFKARVDVQGRTRKLDKGYLGVISTPPEFRFDLDRIRDKIASKTGQLPRDRMNMVIVQRQSYPIDKEIMEEVLYGQTALRYNGATRQSRPIRQMNGVFKPDQNTRIGAVLYCEILPQCGKVRTLKIIFHNPFASNPIPPELLYQEDTPQLVPVKEYDRIDMKEYVQ